MDQFSLVEAMKMPRLDSSLITHLGTYKNAMGQCSKAACLN